MEEWFIRCPRWALPARGRPALCAVSGGLDSMCLLDLLVRWCREREARVVAAHFNHHLRGAESDRDERFVRDWCAAHNIPFVSGSGDAGALAAREGLSVEEAARNLRYAFLRREAEKLGPSAKIYTAHHADDNAETILFNLIRGTGVAGLTGMAYQQDGICRPLLNMTREELAAYAAAHHIPHVEDSTNGDPDAAARNYLRLEVMPRLKQINPRAVEHINGAGRRLRVVDRSLEEEAARRTAHVEIREGRVILSKRALAEAPDAVRPRMLLRLFDLLGVGRRDITAAHLNAILYLTRNTLWGRESRLDLPHGVTARYCREWLMLETRPQLLTEVQLLPGCPVIWGDCRITLLDHREGEGLALRPWQQGERMGLTVGPAAPGDRLCLPETHGGGRSVKRLCLDHRISLSERDRLPAIYAGGTLAAVWRLGVDEAFSAPAGEPCRFVQITKIEKEREHEK